MIRMGQSRAPIPTIVLRFVKDRTPKRSTLNVASFFAKVDPVPVPVVDSHAAELTRARKGQKQLTAGSVTSQ